MSTFRGWKEERIRHHIYLDQLKAAQNSSDGVSLNGAHFEERNGSPDLFLQGLPDNVRDRRTETKTERHGFHWTVVRLAILAAGAAAWFWLYLGQLGVHR
jgi:hypothetical protein